jgi:cysteinyl-tRNA synthetase
MASSTLAFLYQLQGMDYAKLANTDFKVAVVDDDATGLNKAQLNTLQNTGKAVMAYLSVGEAENYRDYWQPSWNTSKPDFLLKENPIWEGNYNVKFWDAAWQKIVIEKAIGLAKEGYNGITLDVVDVYSVKAVVAAYKGSSDVRSEMIKFVSAISDATKAINPNFKIMQNNALDLLTVNPTDPKSGANTAYLAKIDAVNAEEAFYGENNQAVSWGSWDRQYLDNVIAAGKSVFNIEYPTSEAKQIDAIAQATAKGYIPYVSDMDLSKLDATNYEVYSKLAAGALDRFLGTKNGDAPAPTATTNVVSGTDKADTLAGVSGADKLYGQKGNDALSGNEGDDFLYAGFGKDTLKGGAGNDYMEGNQGRDWLEGGAGSDTMHGGLDNDSLIGGAGNDMLYGGAGRDVFFFGVAAGKDVMMDFEGAGKAVGDLIQISKSVYTSVAEILKNITYAEGNAVIDLGEGNSVTLSHIAPNALISSDFQVV